VREAIAAARAAILSGGGAATLGALLEDAAARARVLERRALRRAVNATGVVLHTGLGRAVLAEEAAAAVHEVARGYSLLEVDPETGERGVREARCAGMLRALTGAPAASVVNNNAAATLLMLAALARGREVIVARGQLVEIGGSFRIPEVMAESGARLREVGATNKVRIEDYERAIGLETAAILRVHPSNFKVVGFTEEVPLERLAALARARGLLLLDDVGSGCLVDLPSRGLPEEPPLAASIAAGADVVCASGDKLLGAPQCGVVIGSEGAVGRMRRHPLFRALRPDKLCLAGLEATLAVYLRGEAEAFRRVPGLRMLAALPEEVRGRAEALLGRLEGIAGLAARVVPSEAEPGSGALPAVAIPSFALALDARPALAAAALARRLRTGEPAVFPRIRSEEVLLDLRTVLPGEEEEIERAVRAAVGAPG
jgi:L-seryl-tRNA(Ser) seleniumtransferase